MCTRRTLWLSSFGTLPGVVIPQPEGAFYALPEVTAFFGPGVEADDFGQIPDVDTLCR